MHSGFNDAFSRRMSNSSLKTCKGRYAAYSMGEERRRLVVRKRDRVTKVE